jgi:tRNA (mo5U34)-methyltransferase
MSIIRMSGGTNGRGVAAPPSDAAPDVSQESLQRQADALGPWFHNLQLPCGLQTAPDHPLGPDFPARKWREIEPHLPARLDGWTVLDIGCNAGFYSIELALRGAEVVGVDHDPHYLRQAAWAAVRFGVEDRIELRQQHLYELAASRETFDLVWFMGVFYHLRYPLLGLDIAASKAARMMVFQTLTMPGTDVCTDAAGSDDIEDRDVLLHPGWPKMAFLEHAFFNDPTNWWAPNHAAVEAMLRSAGLNPVQRPGHEIYICEPARDPNRVMPWQSTEFAAATGRSGTGGATRERMEGIP